MPAHPAELIARSGVAVSAVLTGMVPYAEPQLPAPVALALAAIRRTAGCRSHPARSPGTAGVMLVMLLAAASSLRDVCCCCADLPARAPEVWTPYIGTLLTGAVAATVAGLLTQDPR
jgi:hypothetical protein